MVCAVDGMRLSLQPDPTIQVGAGYGGRSSEHDVEGGRYVP